MQPVQRILFSRSDNCDLALDVLQRIYAELVQQLLLAGDIVVEGSLLNSNQLCDLTRRSRGIALFSKDSCRRSQNATWRADFARQWFEKRVCRLLRSGALHASSTRA